MNQAVATTRRAVQLLAPGGPEELALRTIETPSLGTGDVLVEVHAAAITRDELDWPTDRLPAIPSYELSGVVLEVAPDADMVAVGEHVYALTPFDRDGVAADVAVVPAGVLAPKPHTLGHVEAAAAPMGALTARQGLFDHGRLEPGQRVLVHGAAGGVGHLAVQLARIHGAHVIATASAASIEAARAAGAHDVLDRSQAPFDALEPVDLVFDTVGGETLARSVAVIRPGGRLVSVAEEPAVLPAESGIEAVYFVVEPSRDQLVELTALIDDGRLRPEIDSVFPLEDARAAFERSLAPGKRGKVVLRVAD